MKWSLDQAYDAYPRVEEKFSAALDESLEPRGQDQLFDLVAELTRRAYLLSTPSA